MELNEAWRLRILYFLVFSCTASWLPIFADYLTDHGLNGIEVGVILSISPLVMFVVQPFYGILADRFGYKKCLLFSSILAATTYVFYLVDVGFTGLLIITLFMALFYNSIQPLLDSIALDLVQKDPKFSYGTLRIAGAAGWALTGTVVGYSIDKINTSVIFAFSASTMLLTFLFATLLNKGKNKINTDQRPAIQNLQHIFTNGKLIFLLVCVFLVSTGGTTIWNFYSIYMKENGASASFVGYGLSLQGLCELPFFYFASSIVNKLGRKSTLLITVLATSLRMFLYSIVAEPQVAIFIEVLHGLSWSLFWVVCVEYVNVLVPTDWRATGQSLLYAAYFGLGAIVGNFWTGYLYDSEMRISDIFMLNAAIVGVVALFIWMFMPTPHEEKNAPEQTVQAH